MTLDNTFGNVRYDARIVDKGIEERQKAIDAIRTMKLENPDLYGALDDDELGTYYGILNNYAAFLYDSNPRFSLVFGSK